MHSVDREASGLVVSFNGRKVSHPFGEVDAHMLAYAQPALHRRDLGEAPVLLVGERRANAIVVKAGRTGR